MPSLYSTTSDSIQPEVAVLVPLRNEEKHVPALLESLSQLSYPNLSFYFLNDGSTDQTLSLLTKHVKQLKKAHIINGETLPAGWVGKVHACHQLSQHAYGSFFLFIDADIRLNSDTIERCLHLMIEKRVGLLTGFPRFPTKTILSKILVPMQHVVVLLHLPLFVANHFSNPAFTAAHGSFMFFSKKAYEDSGGHQAVKNSLVEDVHLTRLVKKSGHKVCLANITRAVTCFMYETNQEVWNGFSKNIFPGLGRSVSLVLLITLFYISVFLVPCFLLFYGLITGTILYCLPLILTFLIRLVIDQFTKQERWTWLLMPISCLMLIVIMYYSMYLGLRKKGFEWKGRRYQ